MTLHVILQIQFNKKSVFTCILSESRGNFHHSKVFVQFAYMKYAEFSFLFQIYFLFINDRLEICLITNDAF